MAESPISVTVRSTNRLARAGASACLDRCPDVRVVRDGADVAVVVEERVTPASLRSVLSTQVPAARRTVTVLVAGDVCEQSVELAVAAGVVALVRLNSETVGPDLVAAVRCAARGGASFPPPVQRQITARLSELRAHHPAHHLSDRERTVLGLLADGLDNRQIAERLSYSERTIKYLLHGVMTRLGVRTRVGAVAYAIRHGLC